MKKRYPGTETFKKILPRAIHDLGPKVEKEYYRQSVMSHWPSIVGEAIAANVKPQKIEFKKIFLYTASSAWKNEISMLREDIIQKINNYAGEALVKEIFFTQYPTRPEIKPATTAPEVKLHLGRAIAKTNISSEQLKKITQSCQGVADAELRCKLQQLYQNHQKLTNLKISQGWHKCADCKALCPPKELRCTICSKKHQEETMVRIRAFLTDTPWARHKEVNEYIPCTPAMVNRQRSAMVQRLAGEIYLEDYNSVKAKQLTMLYNCLPPELLSEYKVRQTLYKLRFDLAKPKEFKPVKRYEYLGLGDKKRKK